MAKGWWIFLTSISTQLALAMDAFRLVRDGMAADPSLAVIPLNSCCVASQGVRHDSFRLFLIHSGSEHLPEPLLTSCTTTYMSPDWTLQGRLAQALAEVS